MYQHDQDLKCFEKNASGFTAKKVLPQPKKVPQKKKIRNQFLFQKWAFIALILIITTNKKINNLNLSFTP